MSLFYKTFSLWFRIGRKLTDSLKTAMHLQSFLLVSKAPDHNIMKVHFKTWFNFSDIVQNMTNKCLHWFVWRSVMLDNHNQWGLWDAQILMPIYIPVKKEPQTYSEITVSSHCCLPTPFAFSSVSFFFFLESVPQQDCIICNICKDLFSLKMKFCFH